MIRTTRPRSRANGLMSTGLVRPHVALRRFRALLGAVHRGSQRVILRSENCFLPSIHTFTSFRKRQTSVLHQFGSHNLNIRIHLSLPDVHDLGELSYILAWMIGDCDLLHRLTTVESTLVSWQPQRVEKQTSITRVPGNLIWGCIVAAWRGASQQHLPLPSEPHCLRT
jgi:hypothetical protein